MHDNLTVFDRQELNIILNIYGRMVASGQWKDYAIDHLEKKAVFSIFQHFAERPVYMVEKQPDLRKKKSLYKIINRDGSILRRGNELKTVLRLFDRKLLKIVD